MLRRVFHSSQMPPGRLQSRLLRQSGSRSPDRRGATASLDEAERGGYYRRGAAHDRGGSAVHQPLGKDERRRRRSRICDGITLSPIADFALLSKDCRAAHETLIECRAWAVASLVSFASRSSRSWSTPDADRRRRARAHGADLVSGTQPRHRAAHLGKDARQRRDDLSRHRRRALGRRACA